MIVKQKFYHTHKHIAKQVPTGEIKRPVEYTVGNKNIQKNEKIPFVS